MFNENWEVTIANIYWALITPTTLFQALRMFYPSLQIKDKEALSWKLPQSVTASIWWSPHSNPGIWLRIPRYYLPEDGQALNFPQTRALLSRPPNCPEVKRGGWALRGKNNTAESPKKKNSFNKAQLPCKLAKEAPRSATGFMLRFLWT